MDTDKVPPKRRQEKTAGRPDYRWIGVIFGLTMAISGTFSFISGEILQETGIVISFLLLLAIVLIGVVFDVIGVAVTAAKEQPFHSMAARKVPEAPYALRLLRKADRVSSLCNDIIGDICGIISGTAVAAIAASVVVRQASTELLVCNLILSALVAALTVGGKAFGKFFAIAYSTEIVRKVSAVLCFFDGMKQAVLKFFQRK